MSIFVNWQLYNVLYEKEDKEKLLALALVDYSAFKSHFMLNILLLFFCQLL